MGLKQAQFDDTLSLIEYNLKVTWDLEGVQGDKAEMLHDYYEIPEVILCQPCKQLGVYLDDKCAVENS